MTSTTLTTADVAALANRMGRKFEVDDVTDELWDAAVAYVSSYTGSFDYLLKVKDFMTRRSISEYQVKGVLNCMAAEGRRQAPKPAPAAPAINAAAIPNGIYMPSIDGRGVTIQIEDTNFGDFPAGTRTVKVKNNARSEGERAWTGFGFIRPDGAVSIWQRAVANPGVADGIEALSVVIDAPDPLVHGFAYALATGRCWVCNRELDDPVSVLNKIGPICAKKIGYQMKSLSEKEAVLATFEMLISA